MMEREISDKDKSSEISRLHQQIEQKDALYEREWSIKVHRLEEELQTRENRYNLLLDQFEQVKKESVHVVERSREEKVEIKSDPIEDIKKVLRETLEKNNDSQQIRELVLKMETLQ